MKNSSYPLYALIAAGGLAVALWMGMPIAFLFILVCPVMMFFMMRGMSSGQHGKSDNDRTSDENRDQHV